MNTLRIKLSHKKKECHVTVQILSKIIRENTYQAYKFNNK